MREHTSRDASGVANKKIKKKNEREYIERCQMSCQAQEPSRRPCGCEGRRASGSGGASIFSCVSGLGWGVVGCVFLCIIYTYTCP